MVIIAVVLKRGCQLQHTLQTWQGMVQNGGRALRRLDAMHESFFTERQASILADSAAHLLKLADGIGSFDVLKRDRVFLQNMWACTGGQGRVTERTLLDYIRYEKRLDVEQAVAMVLAFVPKEVGQALAPHVAEMFVNANMWREGGDFEVEDSGTLTAARGRKMMRLRDAVVAMGASGARDECFDESLLVDVLMRVRRDRSAFMSCKQRLRFPEYLIALLPEHERDAWTESYTKGLQTEVEIEEDRIVKVSKRAFSRIQRWLLRLDGDKSEKSAFIREVALVEKEIFYGGVRLDALEKTTDRAALAFSFMAVQRRLQLKVVSDLGFTEFLQKGQGSGVLQNRPDIVTSFEEELARLASDGQALIAIRPPKDLEVPADHSKTSDELISQVDRVCTLMEQYVLLFGDGHFENLRFSKIPKDNWKGRGPESAYNLLVDLLVTLRERGRGRFTIGPCHKFLAKDIMAWSNGWSDDAFAPGKIPGWVKWLEARQKLRIQLPKCSNVK